MEPCISLPCICVCVYSLCECIYIWKIGATVKNSLDSCSTNQRLHTHTYCDSHMHLWVTSLSPGFVNSRSTNSHLALTNKRHINILKASILLFQLTVPNERRQYLCKPTANSVKKQCKLINT